MFSSESLIYYSPITTHKALKMVLTGKHESFVSAAPQRWSKALAGL